MVTSWFQIQADMINVALTLDDTKTLKCRNNSKSTSKYESIVMKMGPIDATITVISANFS